MSHLLLIVLESILFVTALSTDAMVAGLAYGSNKIKIPFLSAVVITAICTGVLGVSLLAGSFLRPLFPGELLKVISFLILLFLGVTRLLDNMIKSMINKNACMKKEIKFHLFDLCFILNIYANPKDADYDQSKVLSPKEALSLALALSIDSLAAGVGAALGDINIIAALLASLLLSMIAIKIGDLLGYKISDKVPFQLSWISGALLIFLAVLRFL